MTRIALISITSTKAWLLYKVIVSQISADCFFFAFQQSDKALPDNYLGYLFCSEHFISYHQFFRQQIYGPLTI